MRFLLSIALLAIAASATELTVPEWRTPPRSDTKYYPDKDASVGDTITFSWPENYIVDVFKYPTGDCSGDDKVLVGYQPGASYTFTLEDAGKEIFFANSVGRRCYDGQNIVVRVADAPLQVSAVKQAASAAVHNHGTLLALALTAGFAVTLVL